MRLDTLRMVVGFSIIASHIVTFYLILLGTDSFMVNERTELALLISPIFAVYVAAIVRRFAFVGPKFDASPTHPALRILSIGSSTVFSVTLPLLIFFFITGRIPTLAALKATLGVVETGLGVYTGAIIDRLFGWAEAQND